jgi:hypothetical protein
LKAKRHPTNQKVGYSGQISFMLAKGMPVFDLT